MFSSDRLNSFINKDWLYAKYFLTHVFSTDTISEWYTQVYFYFMFPPRCMNSFTKFKIELMVSAAYPLSLPPNTFSSLFLKVITILNAVSIY